MIKLSGIGKRRILKSFFRKINAPYELEMHDADTGEKIFKLSLTKKSAYLLISSFLVISFLIVSVLFLFTPIKYYIPGFETNTTRSKLLALNAKVDSLISVNVNREAFMQNLFMVAQGNEQYLLDTLTLNGDEITKAEIANSGQIDNAGKYAHLLQTMIKKAADSKDGDEEMPVDVDAKAIEVNKIEEAVTEPPKKKYRDTIIIRKKENP